MANTLLSYAKLPKTNSTYNPTAIKAKIANTNADMESLRLAGHTEAYKSLYEDLSDDVAKYNKDLIDAKLTLSEYNDKIREIKKQLNDNKNVVTFLDPENIENARLEMKAYAEELSDGKAKLISSTDFTPSISSFLSIIGHTI